MLRCTGMCSSCKRCYRPAQQIESNDIKTKPLLIPDDFVCEKNGQGYGIAFDIGTTTVVGIMWDFAKAELMGLISAANPQIPYGADVISRIAFASEEDNLRILQKEIATCLSTIAKALCEKHSVSTESVVRVTVCGNTAMAHLLLGISPKSLAVAPFRPGYSGTVTVKAKTLGIKINEKVSVTVMPNIAGHVGSDITAGILALRLEQKKGRILLIDIGTNGEIVYYNGERMLTCSTAAGPAFEGASVRCGMRATAGAIERVRITDGEIKCSVIGNTKPLGICGSGIIDTVSELVKNRIVDKTGRMLGAEEYSDKYGASPLCQSMKTYDNVRCFVLAQKESGEDIIITQKDIREVQLAKAAIAAGIHALRKETGDNGKALDTVYLAGAFGNYIDKNSASSIGLLPVSEGKNIIAVGNTAGAGILMAMTSSDEMKRAEIIAGTVQHIDLYARSDFQKDYLNKMYFNIPE